VGEEKTSTMKLISDRVKGYLFNIDSIADLKINELQNWVVCRSGIKIEDIKIKDLVFHKGKPINSGNGVYIFKKESEILYVGKCSSRVFSERIPSHFDLRSHAWMNSLLVNLIGRDLKRKDKSDKTNENLLKFAEYALKILSWFLSISRIMIRRVLMIWKGFSEKCFSL